VHGLRVLLQQRQVGAAPADGVEQVEQALEGGVGVGGFGGGLDDPRDQRVEAHPDARRHLLVAAAAAGGRRRAAAAGSG
jgi:hypothetical protein